MATTTDTHNVALTEGFAIDGETSAPSQVARTPHLPTLLPMAHVEIVSLNCEVTLLRKRIESMTQSMRDLEGAIYTYDTMHDKREAELVELSNKVARFTDYLREAQEANSNLFDIRVAHEAHIAELQSSLAMMTEIAEVAARDADKYIDNARDLSQMLEESGKREDRAHETLMGIRALAESAGLSDHEKVALILRLA